MTMSDFAKGFIEAGREYGDSKETIEQYAALGVAFGAVTSQDYLDIARYLQEGEDSE